MRFSQLSRSCRLYLVAVYLLGIPFAALCFFPAGSYTALWILLTLTSAFVATINVRLPKISSVISMGDVFIILALTRFGPGPALVTYWVDIFAAHLVDVVRKTGLRGLAKVMWYRFVFNLACCAISVWIMWKAYGLGMAAEFGSPANQVLALGGVALAWFLANTLTVSMAISFWSNQKFAVVWREGVGLYLLNFFGSAAAAGLISLFYERAGFFVMLLSLPIAVVLYQLYLFNFQKYEQAQKHIHDLNTLYLETIEVMASVVDAKDPYTHGHIRRVQVYSVCLAECLGITDENHLMAIRAGALLHDIGKIAIPEYILNKPTVLTANEYEKMKIHPVVGANMLKGIHFPFPVEPLVKSHHERWDGKGYPEGLSGEAIPISARILSVADCYDALTTNRPYRSPMPHEQLVQFFQREAGRAYDPSVIDALIKNLDTLQARVAGAHIPTTSVWDIDDASANSGKETMRPLEHVQPTRTYDQALRGSPEVQRELYSVFEFARAESYCLSERDVLFFMGAKLEALVRFDAAVFYLADDESSTLTAKHVIGSAQEGLVKRSLKLDQKLSGWVAVNNQSLSNLPPFPDFLSHPEPKPNFENSCIVPLNKEGVVLGTLSLYRKEKIPFAEEEFRRLEIVASQTSLALHRVRETSGDEEFLVDTTTGVANGFHLYLMFDQVAMDAARYHYPLALIAMRIDSLSALRRRHGQTTMEETLRSVSRYLGSQMRDTDILVRYAHDEFMVLAPKMNREQADTLVSRLQNELDQNQFRFRSETRLPISVAMGAGIYPEDGLELEHLIERAEWHLRQDQKLRVAVRNRVRPIT